MELNQIICGEASEVMAGLQAESIDMVLTSPPYDNLRNYNGYTFNFETIAQQLWRVIKPGGVVVWVVGDATINGSETGTSFKQALRFKEIGFNLHDTMIYMKDSFSFPESNRYLPCFEYMFVLSKSTPLTFNSIKERTRGYQISNSSTVRNQKGELEGLKYEKGKAERSLFNIWKFGSGYMKSSVDKISFRHPATFPEQLAEDHILSWSNKGDIVLDPMCGSGTTCKMAMLNDRNYLGIDISEEYCELSKKRIEMHQRQGRLF